MTYHDIETMPATDEFRAVWVAAGQHIQRQVESGSLAWLRADLNPPMREHLSFRIGNQLFFIRITDEDGVVSGPGSVEGLMNLAQCAQGIACIMPMRKKGQSWFPVFPGWGLVEILSGKSIDPLVRVSDELIVMSDWELQDFANTVVLNYLKSLNSEVLSSQSNPEVHPSIWFVDADGPSWILVMPLRYPENTASLPDLAKLEKSCKRMSEDAKGYIAWVKVANADDPFDPAAAENNNFMELYRGHGCVVSFAGLTPIQTN